MSAYYNEALLRYYYNISIAVASFFGVSLFSSSKIQAQSSQQQSIRICYASGDKLADWILTYKIMRDSINTDSIQSEQAVYNAINDWNSKLHGIKLVEVSSNTRHSDLISDLMYPVINRRTNTDISDCDIHAVYEANS